MRCNTSDRILYIERLRVLATFSIIILHCNGPYFIDCELFGTRTWWGVNAINAIIRWGVPVFFMISGKLLINSEKEEVILDFIKKRCSKVVLPFMVWSGFYYVDYCLNLGKQPSLSEFIIKFLQNDISYHFWFVYTLFGLYLCVPFLRKLKQLGQDSMIRYLFYVIFFTSTIIPFVSFLVGVKIYALITVFNGYLGWFLYGYILDKVKVTKKQKNISYLLGIAGFAMSLFGTYWLSNSEGINAFFNGGYQLNIYMVATMMFLFFKYDFEKILFNPKMDYVFMKLEKLSYGVYLIHIFVLRNLQIYLHIETPYVALLIYSSLTIVLSYIVMEIIYMIVKKKPKLAGLMTGYY